jgi:hypothetical protein
LSITFIWSCSGHLRRPAPLPGHVVGPALAAAGEVLALGDQALMQLAGEHRDAVHPGVMPEPVAGHADLAAAGLHQQALIEERPVFDWGFKLRRQGRRPGERDTHEPLQMRTSVLTRVRAGCCRDPWSWIRFRQ